MRPIAALIVAWLLLAGCGGAAATPSEDPTPAATPNATPIAMLPEAAVCEVFDEPTDDIREVFEVIEADEGNVVSPLISAKERLLAIAEELDAVERDDVMALHDDLFVGSEETTSAALDAWDTFQAKYAEPCGG